MLRPGRLVALLTLAALLAALGWLIQQRLSSGADSAKSRPARSPAPVAVAALRRDTIALPRRFSGSLEASASFLLAPKVSGRVERLAVDIGDTIRRHTVVAQLDNAEFQQALQQAIADQAVAQANLVAAQSALQIADRELKRVADLQGRGVTSAAQYDSAQLNQLAKQAEQQVAAAQLQRADALLEAARIRLGYTAVSASWQGDDAPRLVAERFVDEGETVAINTALLRVVAIDPIIAVLQVTEGDYTRLQLGHPFTLTTDAWPGEQFHGRLHRIAPVFQQQSRQARLEITIANPQQRLKPGMFVRAETALSPVTDALLAPLTAITRREGKEGLFLVNAAGDRVRWQPITRGIDDGVDLLLQMSDLAAGDRVVVLGQQLINDGSAIQIVR